MTRTQATEEDGAEVIDAAELLTSDTYNELEPSVIPDNPEAREHGLFLERLAQLMREQDEALKLFAERERRPADYIRRHVALMHSKFLFEQTFSDGKSHEPSQGPSLSARSVVARVCSMLDSLHTAGHYESLVLVTSARDGDKSFIGGTKVGKLFWDAQKMGGSNGVKMFKNHCKIQATSGDDTPAALVVGRKCKNSLKSELNTAMRIALRNASGNSAAEMRWTKPEQIENWGVRISGWPSELPFRNPSNNTVQVNTRLLELLKSGKLKFVKPGDPEWAAAAVAQPAKPANATTSPTAQPESPAHQSLQSHAQSATSTSAPPAAPSQATVMSHVQLPPGVVLHAGPIDQSDLMRRGAALFHTLPPGVSLNSDTLRHGMVALPLSVALPVISTPHARIEPAASTSRAQDAPQSSAAVHGWPQPATQIAPAPILKRKRDPVDNGGDAASARSRTPAVPTTIAPGLLDDCPP